MSDRPLIGISAYSQQARWGSWDLPAVLLPRRYTDMVAAAGGLPVLLPPLPDAADVLGRLDGLVLSGGGDIDPARYGAARDHASGPANAERDAAELGLWRHALASGLPVLGICRGLQVVNVAQGGTLHQHLPDLVGHDGHSPDPGAYGSHKVSVAPTSRLAGALGRTETAVPTHHHQAIDRLGAGLVATAWTDDGVIEAVEFGAGEDPAGAGGFMLAVQWHPEAGDDLSLFTGLAAAAQRYRDGR
ncbi:MAG TPA: gamma-glutamyl-gamma-aminobutyrate hydrolase family protein [Streptosporangiaceae bacterium]|nr:gamma-glutamyl-gamma-aminobutyrate hydrolase family protein [Streptosporangiaceae bacterium]